MCEYESSAREDGHETEYSEDPDIRIFGCPDEDGGCTDVHSTDQDGKVHHQSDDEKTDVFECLVNYEPDE